MKNLASSLLFFSRGRGDNRSALSEGASATAALG